MRTLQIKQDSLLVAFRNAGKEGKQVLSDLFGKQVALYDNITDRVKSFEDACQVLGISTNVPEVKGLPRKHQKAIIANYKLIVIAEALNEGWKPNWQDSDEYKYYPWFDMSNPAGVGCSYTNDSGVECGCDYRFSALLKKSRTRNLLRPDIHRPF